MRFLVIGGGSIGKRHLRNLLLLGEEVAVVEPVRERAQKIANEYRVKVYSELGEALADRYEAALITNPNVFHLSAALQAARAGCHLFIEKPLSHSVQGVDELVDQVDSKKLKTLMGCNWKFHPSFQKMKGLIDNDVIGRIMSFNVIAGQYLPDWHPLEDYRKGYSANRSMGGGVLLDSHEFDYLQWFLGPIRRLSCFCGKYSDLEIDTEDVAEVIVELEGPILGSFHFDYIQHPYRRSYYFYGEKGTIEWSFREKTVNFYSFADKAWQSFKENEKYDLNEMYLEEMRHFIEVLQGKARSYTDINVANRILQTIDASKRSSFNRCAVELE